MLSSLPRFFLIILFSAAVAAPTQTPFQIHDAGAHVQDAVLCPSDGSVYMAVSDRGMIWKVNPETCEVLKNIPVDKGVAALAISSDGATLGCVSALSNTVSFIRVADNVSFATGHCPKGACDIAALPDGRFAVASSFTDEISIFTPSAAEPPETLKCAGSVPVAIAANDAFLAVVVRVPASIEIFPLGSVNNRYTVPLNDAPMAVAPLANGRFAVATASRLLIVDARTRAITAETALAAKSVCADGGRLFALTQEAVLVLNPALENVQSTLLASAGATVVAACGDFVMALSPGARLWQATGRLPQPVAADKGLVVVEAEPVTEKAPAVRSDEGSQVSNLKSQIPEKAAPAVAGQTAPVAEKAPVASPNLKAPTSDLKSQSAKKAPPATEKGTEKKKTPKENNGVVYRRTPLTTPDIGAPRPWRRVIAMPTGRSTRLTLSDTLNQRFAPEPTESLQPPDWTQPLRDVEADVWKSQLGADEYDLEGNVRLQLDTLKFTADEFWYSKTEGRMRATGNVLILQDPTVLTADEIQYLIPEESEAPKPSLLAPRLTEQEQAKLRLSLGKVEGTNVNILQPTQELSADRLVYDVANSTGEFDNARGHTGIYYFNAQKLRILGPGSLDGEEVWVTTCDHDPPHYRILIKRAQISEDGHSIYGEGARLQIGGWKTPVYWPWWNYEQGQSGTPINFEFKSGHRAKIGDFINTGQQFAVTPESTLGLRLFPTTRAGIGVGVDSQYDFTKDPASPLFLGKGEIHTLYTTKDRGYGELYHRQEIFDNTVLLLQAEQWSDRDFYKDFYYPEYRNRTAPRTFANVTYTQPTYIATGTVSKNTQGFVHETERLPEATFHLLERRLADNLYFSFDTINGYNEREPNGSNALRTVNIGRFTYDLKLHDALNITPFLELEGTGYSKDRYSDRSDFRFGNTIGTTVQTRFHKTYPGFWGFSEFKHIIVPSVTYSYRPEPTMGVAETPRFDSYDDAHGRSRIETKLANVLLGKDAETGEIWQVARLTLYQGNDFWNEISKSDDYEAELDLRPRPWCGWLMAAEYHGIEEDPDPDLDLQTYWERRFLKLYDKVFGRPYYEDPLYQYDSQYGDYSRLLTYVYYDQLPQGGLLNAHLGFAYTETENKVFNREMLYGLGCRLGDQWGVAFEHRYDIDHNRLALQKYEIRRRLHCWEAALVFSERHSGWDMNVEFSIAAFPGTKVKF